ncbi:hypothetical protein [Phytoactinopolyspora halotolerans]|uniref:DUF4386 family protein n=1 Tax=Phytoactinopolyspora halotolerans TaxID=1981512 RepID=A0A6L9S357_9ACTN|nr:hypothetical protein [Phytoactinopolyspora halotolerans]NED99063.1 hypothetical protein [Phytoactinopolyspora halotolerans]
MSSLATVRTPAHIRLGSLALGGAGVMFVLYPTVRPWDDEDVVGGAVAAMSSSAWVASHLFAMVGFILVPLGLLAVRRRVTDTRAEALAATAAVTTWVGAGLTLPYYGAEDFALNAIAEEAAAGRAVELLDLVDAIRMDTAAVTTFALGLLTLGVGAVLAAIAIYRSGVLARYSGVPFATGFALFIPQFYAPAPVRIAHGVLVAAGLFWVAVEMLRPRRAAAS